MRVITWNVNSVRSRLPRLLALLARHQPDVVALQETKVEDAGFPLTEIGAAGYRAILHGQKAYNGVALLSKAKGTDIQRGFPGDPFPAEHRVVSAVFDGIRVVNAYVINGQDVGAPRYAEKLRWLDALNTWLTTQTDAPVLAVGDWNVAPDDRDVHDPARWKDHVLCSTEERERVGRLLAAGYTDVLRALHAQAGIHTWWDYRTLAFPKGWGLRIDLAFATHTLAPRCHAVTVDREERKETTGQGKPSDHAPVIVDIA